MDNVSIDELDTWKEFYTILSEEREDEKRKAKTPSESSGKQYMGSGNKSFREAIKFPEEKPKEIFVPKPNPSDRVVAFYGGVG